MASEPPPGPLPAGSPAPRTRRRWWRTWWGLSLIGATTLGAVTVAAVLLNLAALVQWQARATLDRLVAPEHALDRVDLALRAGHLGVHGLRIAQPVGFSGGPLLNVDRVMVDVVPGSLFGARIEIPTMTVAGVTVRVVRRADGAFNLEQVLVPGEPTSAPVATTEKPHEAPIPRVIALGALRITGITVRVEDQQTADDWALELRDLSLEVDGLELHTGVAPDVVLQRAALACARLAISQAPGFARESGGELAAVTSLAVELGPLGGLAAPRTVRSARIDLLTAAIERQADGRTNLAATTDHLAELSASLIDRLGGGRQVPAATPTSAPETNGQPAPALLIEQATLVDGGITYRDLGLAKEPFTVAIDRLRATVAGLWIGNPPTADTPPARITQDFAIRQPAELPVARSGLVARVGPLGDGIPTLTARYHLTGFALDTVDQLVPAGIRTTAGLTALDARIDATIDAHRLDVRGAITTDTGVRYPLRVSGTPQAPVVDLGPVLAGVFNRFGGSLLNLGGKAFGVGKDLAAGGLSAVGAVGSGVLDVGKNLGQGLFGVIAGAVTLDGARATDGLKTATAGTVTAAAGTVTGAGSAALGGVGDSVGSVTGSTRRGVWFAATDTRHDVALKQARDALLGDAPAPRP